MMQRYLACALALGAASCSTDRGASPSMPEASSVAASTPSHQSSVWGPLRAAFWRHAGRVDELPAAGARVRVAVLDTAAVAYAAEVGTDVDADGHGRLVGRAIGDLVCPAQFGPGSGCVADVVNYLALPRLDTGSIDHERGGSFGTRAELAAALDRAVADWRRDRAAPGGPAHLIINLSVGWSGGLDGVAMRGPDASEPEAAAVYGALRRASCAGALVVAAAGNAEAPAASGLALPAAWEGLTAPSDAECARDGHDAVAPRAAGADYRPLVHAAAAVDQFDRPLGNLRPGGLPRLAAYGLAVVTHDPRAEGGVTPVASGTSLGTAVTSAAAAVAWAFRPELSADDVMQLVYDAGAPLADAAGAAVAAEACLGAACDTWPARRVSVCETARLALCSGPGGCDAPLACTAPLDERGESLLAKVDTKPFGALTFAATRAAECVDGDCSLQGRAARGDALWVTPQPGGGGCSTCAVDPAANTLLVSVAEAQRSCLVSLELTLATPTGTARYAIARPNPSEPLYPRTFTVMLPDPHVTGRAQNATLWSVVHGNDDVLRTYSTAVPILR